MSGLTHLEAQLALPSTCLLVMTVAVGIATALTWSEFAWISRHRGFHSHGLVDARLGAAAGLATAGLAVVPSSRWPCLLIVTGLSLLIASRIDYGREGSDEIAVVICSGLVIAAAPFSSSTLMRAGFTFITVQLILAYAASGGAKLLGNSWRSGVAVAQILSTRDYGLERRRLFASRALHFRIASWVTIAFELVFPVGLLYGGRIGLITLLAGAAFHVGVAAMMGLNRFAPWFIAAYPAAAWCTLHYGLAAG